MLLDIAVAFLAALGYLVAIIMAGKSSKTEITLSESDIDKIAEKVANKLRANAMLGGIPYTLGEKTVVVPNSWDPPVEIDESPVVVKSKTDGMELAGKEIGEYEITVDSVEQYAAALAAMKGKKK